MIRTWCEYLDYAGARSDGTLDLLERGNLHPIFALRPGTDLSALTHLIRDARERGLEVGIWPLLEEEQGYWPSVRNAEVFLRRLDDWKRALERRGATPDWIAFDIEPPFQPDDDVATSVRRAVRRALANLSGRSDKERIDDRSPADAFRAAVSRYRRSMRGLEREGIGTLGVTTPPALVDLGGEPILQQTLELPWSPLPWDRAGFMAYGSMIAEYSKGLLDFRDVRAIHYVLFHRMRREFGGRAHVSLGLTGTGVYGDEPTYESPEELARDVSAARAANVDDIAIFCLEGLLGRREPGRWIDAITSAEPRVPPTTWRAESVLFGSGIATDILAAAARR